jgi:putative redox protein
MREPVATQPETITSIEIDLLRGMKFTAVGEDGVEVQLDSGPDTGGSGSGFRPMELMLVALGSCTGMDVISILRKKRQDVTGYRVEVDGVRAPQHPHVFTKITVRHFVEGHAVRVEAVHRAIELSEEKYCPAYAMLSKAAPITSSFEVIDSP